MANIKEEWVTQVLGNREFHQVEDIQAILTKACIEKFGTFCLLNFDGIGYEEPTEEMDGSLDTWRFSLRCRSFDKWYCWALINVQTRRRTDIMNFCATVTKVTVE